VQNIVLPSHRCPAVDADAGRHTCVTTTRTGFSEVLILKRLKAAGPVSRILSAELLPQDGHSSGLHITVQLKRPTRRFGAPSRHAPPRSLRFAEAPSLFGLAPCGVCPARCITAAAVRSYRTFSPLPERCRPGGMFSVALAVNRL